MSLLEPPHSTTFEDKEFVLKVYGKHNMIFKTKHTDPEYLKKVGEELLTQKDTDYTHYKILYSNEANEVMTHSEYSLHPTVE